MSPFLDYLFFVVGSFVIIIQGTVKRSLLTIHPFFTIYGLALWSVLYLWKQRRSHVRLV